MTLTVRIIIPPLWAKKRILHQYKKINNMKQPVLSKVMFPSLRISITIIGHP